MRRRYTMTAAVLGLVWFGVFMGHPVLRGGVFMLLLSGSEVTITELLIGALLAVAVAVGIAQVSYRVITSVYPELLFFLGVVVPFVGGCVYVFLLHAVRVLRGDGVWHASVFAELMNGFGVSVLFGIYGPMSVAWWLLIPLGIASLLILRKVSDRGVASTVGGEASKRRNEV